MLLDVTPCRWRRRSTLRCGLRRGRRSDPHSGLQMGLHCRRRGSGRCSSKIRGELHCNLRGVLRGGSRDGLLGVPLRC